MTIDMVKEYLPDVRLRVGCGRVVKARVTGRQNSCVTVYTKVPWGELSYYFSWEAVARAVNNHTVLRI